MQSIKYTAKSIRDSIAEEEMEMYIESQKKMSMYPAKQPYQDNWAAAQWLNREMAKKGASEDCRMNGNILYGNLTYSNLENSFEMAAQVMNEYLQKKDIPPPAEKEAIALMDLMAKLQVAIKSSGDEEE